MSISMEETLLFFLLSFHSYYEVKRTDKDRTRISLNEQSLGIVNVIVHVRQGVLAPRIICW